MTETATASTADQDADVTLESAYRALNSGAWARAESEFRHIIQFADQSLHAEAHNGLGVAAAQGGRPDDAIHHFKQALDIKPHHAWARGNWISVLETKAYHQIDTDRLEDATTSLLAARDLVLDSNADASDEKSRTVLANCFGSLADAYRTKRRDPQRSVELLRVARPLSWSNPSLRMAFHDFIRESGLPANLTDYTDQITEAEIGKHVFIACFPKSGSTFLKKLLVEITGFPDQNLAYAYGKNYTGIYLPDMLYCARNDTVTQLHVRPTDSNLNLMQGFSIKPIILVRNIFDVLLSFKEFHDTSFRDLSFYDRYDELDEHQRLGMIVDSRAAWYLEFFAGWQRAVRAGQVEGMWLTYEDLMRDKVGAAEEILRFYGIDRPRSDVATAVRAVDQDRKSTRFNKGVSGRGQAQFTDDHRAQIERIAAYHPDVDFSMIGL